MTPVDNEGPITPDQIKAKLHDIQGGATAQVEEAKNKLLTIAVIVGLVALIVMFLLGKRSGRRSSAIIEVRRG